MAAEKAAARRQGEIQVAVNAFNASPAGLTRDSFEAGDHVFQYSIDVANQEAIIVAMMGSTTKTRSVDPSDVLNSVCHEGWELVNGDFVFVMEGRRAETSSLHLAKTWRLRARRWATTSFGGTKLIAVQNQRKNS